MHTALFRPRFFTICTKLPVSRYYKHTNTSMPSYADKRKKRLQYTFLTHWRVLGVGVHVTAERSAVGEAPGTEVTVVGMPRKLPPAPSKRTHYHNARQVSCHEHLPVQYDKGLLRSPIGIDQSE
jgi:hypothetical protein